MTRFKEALYDESDPLYAPCISKSHRNYWWKAPRKYVAMGYMMTHAKLPGTEGDGRDAERAAECRSRTRDMVAWAEGKEAVRGPRPGSWGHLLNRYRHDDDSPIHGVKANTRLSYLPLLDKWTGALAEAMLADANYTEIASWRRTMERKGRSVSYIKRMFTMLRMVVNYGVMVEAPECQRIAAVLSKIRLRSPRPRTVAPTREQVMAVIAKADEAGDTAFALGASLQWWLALRAVDVRGQWLPAEKGDGGITVNGKRWQDGLTWDMIDADITVLAKTQSKTGDYVPEPIIYDLRLVPDLRKRLLAVPEGRRVGPVIVDRDGLPYRARHWARLWRKHATSAGVPEQIQMMDLRAGALTEAGGLGATPYDTRDAAGHTNVSTTDRYTRAKSEAVSRVLTLRGTSQKQP